LREGKLTADRQIISGLLQLLDGLRSILKTIEADSNEGAGDDEILIGWLEELQAPAQAKAKQPAHARAGAYSASAPLAATALPPDAPKPVHLEPVEQVPAHKEAEGDPAGRAPRGLLPRARCVSM